MDLKALDNIIDPAPLAPEALTSWIDERLNKIRPSTFTPDVLESFSAVTFRAPIDHPMGPESSPLWRKFFLATLVADWACFSKTADKADYSRLKYVLTSAYPFTTLYTCRLPDDTILPVGYTAWYPIPRFVFDGVLANPGDVDDRGIFLPARFADPQKAPCGYIFNISIIKELRHTACSRTMCLDFHNTLIEQKDKDFLAAVVSPDGERYFTREGFVKKGSLVVQGEPEALFARTPIMHHAHPHIALNP